MYEDLTYEYILERCIQRVMDNYPNLDRREGSMIFNAVASCAMECAILYEEISNANQESFVPTASREYKYIGCKDFGIDTSIFDAHAGTFKGEFNVEVPIGARVNCDLYNYTITKYLGKNGDYFTYSMLCETAGTAPNDLRGSLTFITDIPNGLNYAELTSCITEGENETTDEEINIIFEDSINNTSADGNIKQYEKWCREYDGIGNYKIFSLWNGSNTVKVSILSASNRAASTDLINEFQTYLDPGVTGMGDGKAPIGAFVTVSTATEKTINVTASVTMKNGYSDTTAIDTAISNYFHDIAYEKTLVAYMNIGAAILNTEGVESVSNLKINGGTSDITLGDEEIPVLGTTTWTVT